ncbi:hypothetical protein C8J57DRAFT_1626323 [Mycena rebaudengoi]|nr:hypothetical protein C8J57DRAFT_1626323 [Mycena rebaudengoi]
MYTSTSCTTPSHPPHTAAIRTRVAEAEVEERKEHRRDARGSPPHATYAAVSSDAPTSKRKRRIARVRAQGYVYVVHVDNVACVHVDNIAYVQVESAAHLHRSRPHYGYAGLEGEGARAARTAHTNVGNFSCLTAARNYQLELEGKKRRTHKRACLTESTITTGEGSKAKEQARCVPAHVNVGNFRYVRRSKHVHGRRSAMTRGAEYTNAARRQIPPARTSASAGRCTSTAVARPWRAPQNAQTRLPNGAARNHRLGLEGKPRLPARPHLPLDAHPRPPLGHDLRGRTQKRGCRTEPPTIKEQNARHPPTYRAAQSRAHSVDPPVRQQRLRRRRRPLPHLGHTYTRRRAERGPGPASAHVGRRHATRGPTENAGGAVQQDTRSAYAPRNSRRASPPPPRARLARR